MGESNFDTATLLTNTDTLMNHIFWFYQDLGLDPKKDHHAVSIKYQDILERREDFLNELRCTIASWVYNKSKCKEIIEDRMRMTNDQGNAAIFLAQKAKEKFRDKAPQGQFGELLLFNFIQHFFKAVPLLRKMRITTSSGHERFGADAIHFKFQENLNNLYLGESKCYVSSYKFKEALEKSLTSIEKSLNNFHKELNLYTYEDFIEPELQTICTDLKSGQLQNVRFELICLIVYNETNRLDKNNEETIENSIRDIILDRCASIDNKFYDAIDKACLNRINYIVFPVWDLDNLLTKFEGA